MFERFTPAARDLIIEAQAQRGALHHRTVRTEHLLLALLAEDGPSGTVLRRRGLEADRIVTRLRSGPDDDRLLESLGIEMDAVRRAAEDAFGPGALDRARHRRGRRSGRGTRFDSRSKRVLELSLREALRLKTKHIGPEHIGLGLLEEGDGVACRLLVEEGVELDELAASWEAIALGAATP